MSRWIHVQPNIIKKILHVFQYGHAFHWVISSWISGAIDNEYAETIFQLKCPSAYPNSLAWNIIKACPLLRTQMKQVYVANVISVHVWTMWTTTSDERLKDNELKHSQLLHNPATKSVVGMNILWTEIKFKVCRELFHHTAQTHTPLISMTFQVHKQCYTYFARH